MGTESVGKKPNDEMGQLHDSERRLSISCNETREYKFMFVEWECNTF